MGSEKNDGMSFQPSETKLCANNCGFFGSAGTENLCSKCYRDSRIEAEQAASAKAAMDKAHMPKLIKQSADELPVDSPSPANESPVKISGSSKKSLPATESLKISGNSDKSPPPETPNRCFSCNKKLRLMGYMCKCKRSFCGTHRYAEEHDCDFDYKAVAQKEIAIANPVVKADKIERI